VKQGRHIPTISHGAEKLQVLRGLLEGRIGWKQALDNGLVVVTGDPANRMRGGNNAGGDFQDHLRQREPAGFCAM